MLYSTFHVECWKKTLEPEPIIQSLLEGKIWVRLWALLNKSWLRSFTILSRDEVQQMQHWKLCQGKFAVWGQRIEKKPLSQMKWRNEGGRRGAQEQGHAGICTSGGGWFSNGFIMETLQKKNICLELGFCSISPKEVHNLVSVVSDKEHPHVSIC